MDEKFQKESKNNLGSVDQYVVFLINGQEFGVDITQTKEIINETELTSIPNAPDFVEGVTNLRGEIVPIIDLDKRLNMKKSSDNIDGGKIIIIELDYNLIGMEVADVKGIIRLDSNDIGDAPKITQGINKEYISGVGKLEDNNKLLILLNLTKILSRGEVEQLEDMELEDS